jgi:hypothetical protein
LTSRFLKTSHSGVHLVRYIVQFSKVIAASRRLD